MGRQEKQTDSDIRQLVKNKTALRLSLFERAGRRFTYFAEGLLQTAGKSRHPESENPSFLSRWCRLKGQPPAWRRTSDSFWITHVRRGGRQNRTSEGTVPFLTECPGAASGGPRVIYHRLLKRKERSPRYH